MIDMDISGKNTALAIKLKEALDEAREGRGAGCAAAIVMGGELVASCAAGVTGDGCEAVDVNDLFDIGSISKVYCATAIVRLASKGLIELDAPVTRYLPAFRTRDPRYKEITVRMLLCHSSGLSGTNWRNMITPGERGLDRKASNDLYYSREKLKAAPGEYSVYCNEGFEIAAEIVETVSNMPYMEFLKREILTPMGLVSHELAETPSKREHPMYMRGSKEEYVIAKGAGAIRCTMEDNARFGYAFLHEGVLSREEIATITAPNGRTFLKKDEMSRCYGLGWDAVELDTAVIDLGEHALDKGGATVQFTSFLVVSPKYDIAISVSATMDCGFLAGGEAFRLLKLASDELGLGIAERTPAIVNTPIEPSQAFKDEYSGIYYSSYGVFRARIEGAYLTLETDMGEGFVENPAIPRAAFNGEAFVFGRERIEFEKHGDGIYVLVSDYNMGVPLYPIGQKVKPGRKLNEAWEKRIGKTYISCDLTCRDLMLDGPLFTRLSTYGDGIVTFFLAGREPISAATLNDYDTETFINGPGWGSMNLWTPYFIRDGARELLSLWDYELVATDTLSCIETGRVKASPSINAVFKTEKGTALSIECANGVTAALISSDGRLIRTLSGDIIDAELEGGYIVFISDKAQSEFTVTVTRRDDI